MSRTPTRARPSDRQPPSGYVRLEGSERRPSPGARPIGPADANEQVSVTIALRRRSDMPAPPDVNSFMVPGRRPPRRMPVDEFAAKFGAHPDDIARVTNFVRSHGLAVIEVNAARRTLAVSGTVAQLSAAFAVDLHRYEVPTSQPDRRRRSAAPTPRTYRGRDGFIHVPIELRDIIVGVFGLDNRSITKRNAGDPPNTVPLPVQTVAKLYNFPTSSAAGETIAIFSLGTVSGFAFGGYKAADIHAYFNSLPGLTAPTIVDVTVDASNSGFAEQETTQDICIASTVAQGAQIAVYFTSDDQKGWIDLISRVVHPNAGDPPCSVLSTSWFVADGDDPVGLATRGVTTSWLNAVTAALQDAALQNVTVCVASGDAGSDSNVGDTHAHVQYPASDPWVLSCGGTTVGNITASPFDEYVWNDDRGATGGGVSAFFGLPAYQQNAGVPRSLNDNHVGRGVPDVAANASPNSGYPIFLDGQNSVGEGTSAAAPLYAGLIAVLNAALGEPVGFLNPILYAVGNSVCRDIHGPPGPADNGFNNVQGYQARVGWDACTGWGVINGNALLTALRQVFQKDCAFIIERSTLGKDEIDARGGGAPPRTQHAVVPEAFRVVVDGFTAMELGVTGPASTLNVPSPTAGMTIVPMGNTSDTGDYGPEVQRFTFHYNLDFGLDDTAFNFTQPTEPLTLNVAAATVSATAQIELIKQPDPFILHGDPAWLSIDLRVFVVRPMERWFGVTMGADASAAPGFIQQVAKALTDGQGTAGGQSFDDPNVLSPDEDKSKLYLQPTDNTNTLVLNFALAKVHYIGLSGATDVRVFFRLRQTQVTYAPFDYPPGAQYRRATTNPDGQPIPLAGIVGNEYVTVPCFALPRIDSTVVAMDQQTDSLVDGSGNVLGNVQTITANADGSEVDTFFGCWIDINQPDNRLPVEVPPNQDGPFDVNDPNPNFQPVPLKQALARNLHLCLIAEIAFDPVAIPPGTDPSNWDKLAQRNLAWSDVGSAQALSTFEIRPTPAGLSSGQTPDEVMIDWGNTPNGSSAQIYLPAVNVADILAMAARMYTSHRLVRVDDHTLRCRTGGITYIPIPPGAGSNYAGLLSVDLPATLRRGQSFDVVVRQLTNAFATPPSPPQIAARANPPAASAPRKIEWRRVLGAFQLTIPVKTREVLLEPEERNLSVLRWIAEAIPHHNRWHPVFRRYLDEIAGRVRGFGGDPTQILPSPTGEGRRRPRPRELEHAFTGKIAGLMFDRFGDFEGFLLDTEDGERSFHSREREIGELVERAWRERLRITVLAERDQPHRPISIILRKPPAPFGH